jgi:hypothetical protein
MGTRSITYIYNKAHKLICRLYLQFDGYPSGIGADLAKFLTKHNNMDMEILSAQLVVHFFQEQPRHAMLIAPEDSLYYCEEYEYHIYEEMVRIVDRGKKEYELNWRTDEFEKFCDNYSGSHDDTDDE